MGTQDSTLTLLFYFSAYFFTLQKTSSQQYALNTAAPSIPFGGSLQSSIAKCDASPFPDIELRL